MGMRPVCRDAVHRLHRLRASTCSRTSPRRAATAGAPACRWSCAGPCGGGVGGGPFHSLNPEVYFLHTPGLKMVEPSTAYDAKGLLKAAIRDEDPVLFFEHKYLYRRIKDELPDEDYIVPIGKAAVRRDGHGPLDRHLRRDGPHGARCGGASSRGEGVEVEVIDLRSLAARPGGDPRRRSRRRAARCSCTRRRSPAASAASSRRSSPRRRSSISTRPIMRIASLDTPVPYAPPLEAAFLPNADAWWRPRSAGPILTELAAAAEAGAGSWSWERLRTCPRTS